MIVRLAKMTDISDIVAFAKQALERTNYREFPFNAVIARKTVKESMTKADARVWVAEDEGRICGLLIGQLWPMPMTHYQSASDLAFLADKGGDLLLDAFIAWCKMRKNVVRIDMGISAGPRRRNSVSILFSRKGFAPSGEMFHMNMLPGEGQ